MAISPSRVFTTRMISPLSGALFELTSSKVIQPWFQSPSVRQLEPSDEGQTLTALRVFKAAPRATFREVYNRLLVVLIRLWGGLPEGVMYAILLMNSVTPLINRYTQPRRFGG